MSEIIDYKKVQKTSWTKYDIVHALDVIYSIESIEQYKSKSVSINEPILRSFLGVSSLNDPIPDCWIKIQKYPKEKKLFAFLALMFTHGGIVDDFAEKYSKKNMKGVFIVETSDKQLTNIRSVLVESGASEPMYRKQSRVPYDCSSLLYNTEIGKLFKDILYERLSRHIKDLSDPIFYKNCYENKFHKALGLTQFQFRSWLEGHPFKASYISSIRITNFFCIESDIELSFGDSKEIYFLGENGDGKSLFLMALLLAFKGSSIINQTEKSETGRAYDILSSSITLNGEDEVGNEYNPTNNAIALSNIFAYGTHRGRYSAENYERYGFMSLFSSEETLKSPIIWLKDLKLAEDDTKKISISINELSRVICDILERNVEIEFIGNDVLFKEKGYSLTLDNLSEGYTSIIIFICDLLSRLSATTADDVFKAKGVVLVDEIDQHLHPKWQRKIVRKLRSLFPNIQFFFSTHSPMIIQGASEDAVIFRIYREQGKTKVSDPYYRKDLDHLMINTLVTSSLFGLDDSRLDPLNNNAITEDSMVEYLINKKVSNKLAELKGAGHTFLSEKEISDIIDDVLNAD